MVVTFRTGAVSTAQAESDGLQAMCRSCGAAIIWAKLANGKRLPLNAEVDSAGMYVSHFATCPHAKGWRSQPEKKSRKPGIS